MRGSLIRSGGRTGEPYLNMLIHFLASLHRQTAMDTPAETHLLYILLDSNLPTGGFVASSGLESYVKHGFLGTSSNAGSIEGLVKFVQESVRNYAASTGGFVRDAWRLVGDPTSAGTEATTENALDDVLRLDALYDAMTLNHVTRRSSTAQGIALLTLFSKAFADADPQGDPMRDEKRARGKLVIDRFKRMVRLGKTPGHLPVCWGLLTSSAGLSLGTFLNLLVSFLTDH
jgi:urease accessory protein